MSGAGICLQARGRSQPLKNLSKSIKCLTSLRCGGFGGFLVLAVNPGILGEQVHVAVRSKRHSAGR